MRITELADYVGPGTKLVSTGLTSIPSNYLYVTPENIEKGIAISEASAKYITEKHYKSLSKKPLNIIYGDYLLFRPKSATNYSLMRYVQEINKTIVPAENLIVISYPQGFLTNFLQHETGRLYFMKEVEDITIRSNGNFLEIAKQVQFIDIDSRVLEKVNIPGYIPPGNTLINTEDLKLINVRSDVITIDNIFKRLNENEIRLGGYFQRKANLWADDVKSRLIETIILNMPIPPLFFDVTNDDRWLIVDGLQRISAINSFYKGDLTLVNLDYIPELQGKKYSTLDRKYQRKFEEKQLSYFAIYPGTPKSVRYKIFKNINVSALVLNRQEIRHAINEDEDAEFTSSKYIQNLTEVINRYINIPEKGALGKERMADSELCLRFISFKVLNYQNEYKGAVQDFLDDAMERIHSVQHNKLDIYKVEFDKTLDTLTKIFPPETLFTKGMVQVDGPKNFNSNLFGVWTYLFSILSESERIKIVSQKQSFLAKASNLSNDKAYEKSIDSRYFETIDSLKIHIESTHRFIKQFLNDLQN